MKEISEEPQAYPSIKKPSAAKKWVAVYTRSRYEKKVADALTDQGIATYLPLMKTLRQWSDRKRMVEVPLFKSYVFVNIELPNCRKILEVNGAVYIVKFEGQPAIISDRQIADLKALLDSSIDFEISFDEFIFGEHVEVTHGPLKGQKGIFVEYKGKKRVMMRIDAVGQSLMIDISPAKLHKINMQETAVP